MRVLSVDSEAGRFSITLIEAEESRRIALFAVGRGGNPERHLPLMHAMADRGCTVIAPHFEMLATTVTTKAELDLRIRRLEASIDKYMHRNVPVVGVGHSIGTAALLALQGAKGETFDGQLIVGSKPRFERLALLAPPTDFFRRPGALSQIDVPIKIWVGAQDSITPPSQSQFLMDALSDQTSVVVQVDPDAGHFSYMNELPPNASECHPHRRTFLANLTDEIGAFLTA